ncbi:MAG: hypothetical protein ACRBHB_03915 [Arenicella sp.]
MNNESKSHKQLTRRNMLKKATVATSAASIIAIMPKSWKKPVLDSVILPAHAQTSAALNPAIATAAAANGGACSPGQIDFRVTGTVSSGNGTDLQGVALTIEYTNGEGMGPMPPLTTISYSTNVQAGNTFDSGLLSAVSTFWNSPTGDIVVRFTDQATYGTSSITISYNCFGPGPGMPETF